MFQHEPVSLDVNEVCFEEEQGISNTREKSIKSQSVTEWCRCGKWGVMYTNVEYLSCGKVEALGYFQLLDTRYADRSADTKRVSTTVLQLYLIWTPGSKTLVTSKMELFVSLINCWSPQTKDLQLRYCGGFRCVLIVLQFS